MGYLRCCSQAAGEYACYRVLFLCVPVFLPQKWPKSFPFIVEGRTRVVRVLTIRRRANGGGVSEPCSLLLWRRGRRSGPSLKRWGDVLVTSDPMCHGSSRAASERARRSACGSLWIDYARGRGSNGAEAEPRWGVSADVNPEIAETLA